jgi:hypothetical protein
MKNQPLVGVFIWHRYSIYIAKNKTATGSTAAGSTTVIIQAMLVSKWPDMHRCNRCRQRLVADQACGAADFDLHPDRGHFQDPMLGPRGLNFLSNVQVDVF